MHSLALFACLWAGPAVSQTLPAEARLHLKNGNYFDGLVTRLDQDGAEIFVCGNGLIRLTWVQLGAVEPRENGMKSYLSIWRQRLARAGDPEEEASARLEMGQIAYANGLKDCLETQASSILELEAQGLAPESEQVVWAHLALNHGYDDVWMEPSRLELLEYKRHSQNGQDAWIHSNDRLVIREHPDRYVVERNVWQYLKSKDADRKDWYAIVSRHREALESQSGSSYAGYYDDYRPSGTPEEEKTPEEREAEQDEAWLKEMREGSDRYLEQYGRTMAEIDCAYGNGMKSLSDVDEGKEEFPAICVGITPEAFLAMRKERMRDRDDR